MTDTAHDHRWLIVFIVVMLAVVEVLDMTIVSVALQDMKGALAAACLLYTSPSPRDH
jgi:hypothetical protein